MGFRAVSSTPDGWTGLRHDLSSSYQSDVGFPEMYILAASFAAPEVMLVAAEATRSGVISAPRSLLRRNPQPDPSEFCHDRASRLGRPRATGSPHTSAAHDALRVQDVDWSALGLAAAAHARAHSDVETRDLTQPVVSRISGAVYSDKVVTKACGEEIERHAPNATMVTLPGNHLGMFTNASALAETVAHFVLSQGRHARPAFQTSVRDVTAVSGLSEKTPSMPRQ